METSSAFRDMCGRLILQAVETTDNPITLQARLDQAAAALTEEFLERDMILPGLITFTLRNGSVFVDYDRDRPVYPIKN